MANQLRHHGSPLWREVDRHGTLGSVRLHADAVGRIIKRTCALAGLDPVRYSGHSLRSGMATAAATGGAPERAIMCQGRWASRAMSTATSPRNALAGVNLFAELETPEAVRNTEERSNSPHFAP
jgi:integrase